MLFAKSILIGSAIHPEVNCYRNSIQNDQKSIKENSKGIEDQTQVFLHFLLLERFACTIHKGSIWNFTPPPRMFLLQCIFHCPKPVTGSCITNVTRFWLLCPGVDGHSFIHSFIDTAFISYVFLQRAQGSVHVSALHPSPLLQYKGQIVHLTS